MVAGQTNPGLRSYPRSKSLNPTRPVLQKTPRRPWNRKGKTECNREKGMIQPDLEFAPIIRHRRPHPFSNSAFGSLNSQPSVINSFPRPNPSTRTRSSLLAPLPPGVCPTQIRRLIAPPRFVEVRRRRIATYRFLPRFGVVFVKIVWISSALRARLNSITSRIWPSKLLRLPFAAGSRSAT